MPTWKTDRLPTLNTSKDFDCGSDTPLIIVWDRKMIWSPRAWIRLAHCVYLCGKFCSILGSETFSILSFSPVGWKKAGWVFFLLLMTQAWHDGTRCASHQLRLWIKLKAGLFDWWAPWRNFYFSLVWTPSLLGYWFMYSLSLFFAFLSIIRLIVQKWMGWGNKMGGRRLFFFFFLPNPFVHNTALYLIRIVKQSAEPTPC